MLYGDLAATCDIITGSCTPYHPPNIAGVRESKETLAHLPVRFAICTQCVSHRASQEHSLARSPPPPSPPHAAPAVQPTKITVTERTPSPRQCVYRNLRGCTHHIFECVGHLLHGECRSQTGLRLACRTRAGLALHSLKCPGRRGRCRARHLTQQKLGDVM